MTPRHAILLEAGPESLAAMARSLGLTPPPGADRAGLVGLLTRCPEATTAAMLEHLPLDELREVSRACGLLKGGDAALLRSRILRRAEFEPGAKPRGRKREVKRRGERPELAWRYRGEPFVAIDFETADRGRDSACSVAVVRAEGDAIVETRSRLIRPPRKRFEFTHIHGLRWDDVAEAPEFAAVWDDLTDLLEGAAFMAAHNAPFDRGVLEACCERARRPAPALPWRCTVKLAKRRFGLRRARLPDVCRHLGIGLIHHDATSDAQACAQIMLATARDHT